MTIQFPLLTVLTVCAGQCNDRGHQVRHRFRFRQSRPCSHSLLHICAPDQRPLLQIRTYNPSTALSSLATVPVSLASATQRAGRAGRTSAGICYRLYPESALRSLPHTTPPEITRVDLTTPILQLKSLGIDDLMKFEWVTGPPAEAVLRALENLVAAEMVGEDGRLTVTGEKVAECPVEVNIARMVSGRVSAVPCCLLTADSVVRIEGVQVW